MFNSTLKKYVSVLILMPGQGTPGFFTNKADNHDITEVLLIVALNTNNHNTNFLVTFLFYRSNSFRTNRNCQPT